MPICPRTSASRKPIWGPVMPELNMAEAAAKPAATQVLGVQDLQAWYGESHILHGINFNVNAGEVVTLLGRTGARFLMLDEPTEGLAPVIIQQIGHTIARLKSEGFTILLVEQNFRFASTVADRYYIVEHGKVIDGFANSELSANMDKLHTYLGV